MNGSARRRLNRAGLVIGFIVAIALTVPGWLVVDIDQAWALVPDDVPDALLLAVDRGLTPHEMLGVGTVMALACAAALVAVVLSGRGRRLWMLVASLLSATASVLAMTVTLILRAAEFAVGTLVPDSWDRYDPDLVLAPWGPAFVVVSAGLSIWCFAAWRQAGQSARS